MPLPRSNRPRLLARGDRGSPRCRRSHHRRGDAAMLHCGARGYVTTGRRPAPAARILLRRHRHACDQAAQENAGRHGALIHKAGAARREGATPRMRESSTSSSGARMSEKVLITPTELSTLTNNEPAVLIDTRDPATYAAGHLPGAVNIHDIFTYLATSTPEGVAAMRDKFAGDLRRRRAVREGDRSRLRAVDEYRLRPVVSRLCPAELSRLSEGQDPARRLSPHGRQRDCPRTTDVAAPSAEQLPDRSGRGRHPGRPAEHEGRGR